MSLSLELGESPVTLVYEWTNMFGRLETYLHGANAVGLVSCAAYYKYEGRVHTTVKCIRFVVYISARADQVA